MSLPKDPKKVEIYRKLLSQRAKGRVFPKEHREKLSQAKLKNPVRYWQNKKRAIYYRKYYLENKERKIANNLKWIARNPEKLKRYLAISRNRRKEHLEIIAGRQKPEICEICGGKGRICFDHDHKTGKFRGWICEHCNVLLGFAKEDINRLKLLVKYLKNNSTVND